MNTFQSYGTSPSIWDLTSNQSKIKYSFNKNFDKPQSSIQWSNISLHKKTNNSFYTTYGW